MNPALMNGYGVPAKLTLHHAETYHILVREYYGSIWHHAISRTGDPKVARKLAKDFGIIITFTHNTLEVTLKLQHGTKGT